VFVDADEPGQEKSHRDPKKSAEICIAHTDESRVRTRPMIRKKDFDDRVQYNVTDAPENN
jgi:hypothetical protein